MTKMGGMITRRQTTGFLLASATAPLMPGAAVAEDAESLARKLSEALNGRLQSGCGGQFFTVRFKLEGTRKNVVMRSVVRLDWPPGLRTRAFRSTGGNQQEAITAMFRQSLGAFHDVWPECVRV